MAFILQSFVDNPSLEVIEKCRKDELLIIANRFQITIPKQSLKRKIKAELIDRLSEFGYFKLAGCRQKGGAHGRGAGCCGNGYKGR